MTPGIKWNTPRPSWVVPLATPQSVDAKELAKTQAVLPLLHDQQLQTRGYETYLHTADQALQARGLEAIAELRLMMDPSYERVLIHEARVLRAGLPVFRASDKDVRVAAIDRSHSRMFTDAVNITIILKDVRVGDVVEFAYTLQGVNPVFGGKSSRELPLLTEEPTLVSRTRVLADREAVRITWTSTKELVRGSYKGQDEWSFLDERELTTLKRSEEQIDDSVPHWIDDWEHVSVTDFKTWEEVVLWGERLYPPAPFGALPQLGDWKKLKSAEEKTLAALRFVQDDIRYLGLELGPHSHKPHAPASVLSERLGDCKDKTYLLIQLLRALGIEAAPALVNTAVGRGVDTMQPTPYAFNHVIVRAKLPGGSEHYIDPTWTHQRGTLATQTPVSYERALLLQAGETALRTIPQPQPDMPEREVHEHYSVPSFVGTKEGRPAPIEARALLSVRTIYRGALADEMREYFASRSPDEVKTQYEKTLDAFFAGATLSEEPDIRDDENTNEIQTRLRYVLPTFWVENRRTLPARTMSSEWPEKLVHADKRKLPFAVVSPLFVTHAIEVDLPGDWTLPPSLTAQVDSPFFNFHRIAKAAGSKVNLFYSLRSKVDSGAPEQGVAYNQAVASLDGLYSIELFHSNDAQGSPDGAPEGAFGYAGFVAAALIAFFTFSLARRKAKRIVVGRRYQHDAGESPDTALPANDDLQTVVTTRGCAGCRNKLVWNDQVLVETLRLGESRLKTIELKCSVCQKRNVIYMRLP